jgi:hypothetical protein
VQTSLIYLTVGCLTIVWTAVWYVYLLNHPPEASGHFYWVAGLLLTGLTLVLIGLAVGNIGRSAKPAESAPVTVAAPMVAPTAPVASAPAVPAAPAVTQLPQAVLAAPPAGNGPAAPLVQQPVPSNTASNPVR